MLDIPGLCDRCGFRYLLSELKEIYVKGVKTNILVCDSCWEPSHPQLETKRPMSDKQSVSNARSDAAELAESRRLSSFDPVGHETTGVIDGFVGNVRVLTTWV